MIIKRLLLWMMYFSSVTAPFLLGLSSITLLTSVIIAGLAYSALKLYSTYREEDEILRGLHGLVMCRLECYEIEYSPPKIDLKLSLPYTGKLYLMKNERGEVYVIYEHHYFLKDNGYSPIKTLKLEGFKLKPLIKPPKIACKRIKTCGYAGPSLLVIEGRIRKDEKEHKLIKCGYYALVTGRAKSVIRYKASDYLPSDEAWEIAGRILSRPFSVKFSEAIKDFEGHILIVGASGMGKTTLTLEIIDRFLKKGKHRILVLDWYGEYFLPKAVVLRPGQDVAVNPFSLNFEVGWDNIEEIICYMTAQSYFTPIQYKVARRAAAKLVWRSEELNPRNLCRVLENEEIELRGEDEKNAAAAIVRRLARLIGNPFNFEKLPPDKPGLYVIDLTEFLTDYEKTVFSWFTMQELFYNPFNTPTILVLDEAQRFAPRIKQGETFLERLMREGRKFKIWIIACTQSPSQLHDSIFTNANTIIAFKCTGQDALMIANALSPSYRWILVKEIENLRRGEYLISKPGGVVKARTKTVYKPMIKHLSFKRREQDKVREAIEKVLKNLRYLVLDSGEKEKIKRILENKELVISLLEFKRGEKSVLEEIKLYLKRTSDGYKLTRLAEKAIELVERFLAL